MALGKEPGDSAALLERVQSLAPWKKAASILLYAPLPGEPDVMPLIGDPHQERHFLFPRIEGETLGIYRRGAGSRWITGPFGILEPEPESWEVCSPAEVDLVMVPGLAFDLAGRRLGRGRGYYDRLLGHPEFTAIKVGIGWPWQLLPSVPAEEHDVLMDHVVAE